MTPVLKTKGYGEVATAHEVFGQVIQITGGALLPLIENSPEMVKQFLEAITVYAMDKALEQKPSTTGCPS